MASLMKRDRIFNDKRPDTLPQLPGALIQIDPTNSEPEAKRRYLWARRIGRKTVCVALSRGQYARLGGEFR